MTLRDAIAEKMGEPAFKELAQRLDANINWPRLLPVIKVRTTGVTSWIVMLPGGREIILSDAEWQATIPSRANGERASVEETKP